MKKWIAICGVLFSMFFVYSAFTQVMVKKTRIENVVFNPADGYAHVSYLVLYEGFEDFKKLNGISYKTDVMATVLAEAQAKISEKERITP